MSGMESFDHLAAAQWMSDQINPRFMNMPLDENTQYENQNIIIEFNKIAAEMLKGEPGIAIPGTEQLIPLNESLAMQGLTLFAEGIYFSITKCMELGIVGEIKTFLLQQLALDVYAQAKQMVASTYGQEATPEFQFTMEQQIGYVNQAAENALLYYINEYEKQNGPIQVEFPEEVPRPSVEEILGSADHDAPPVVASAAPTPKGPTPHDKYAAVALLLTTLPQEQRMKVLKNFNVEERELITHYSYPQHIEQHLDIHCVTEHLQRFKAQLKQGSSSLKTAAYKAIAGLVQTTRPQLLLSCVKDERPLVQQYLESHLGIRAAGAGQDDETEAHQERHFSELLPPKVEEVLYRYLQQQVSRAAGQSGQTGSSMGA